MLSAESNKELTMAVLSKWTVGKKQSLPRQVGLSIILWASRLIFGQALMHFPKGPLKDLEYRNWNALLSALYKPCVDSNNGRTARFIKTF